MEEILKVKNSIGNAKNIGILTKINANNDAIGATLALFFALKSTNKKAFLLFEEIPEKISELLKNKEQKKFHISFKEDVSEVYYEKKSNGIDLYLTPKQGEINNESYSCKIITATDYLLDGSFSDYDVLITVGIQEFHEVEELCSNNLDQLYNCTIINIDNDLNNQNYGEINLIEDGQSLCQNTACLIKALGQEYINKEVSSLLLYGLISSPKTNKKLVPTIKWLFRNNGDLGMISQDSQTKILEAALKNLNFIPEKNIYISTLSEKTMIENQASSKDLAFVVEKIKNFFKIPSFLLLWESHTSPLSVKGIFYSDKKLLVEKIVNNFKGVSKGNGALFITEQPSIDLAREKVLFHLK